MLFLGLLRLLRWNQTRLSGKIPEVFFFFCEFGRIIVDLEGTRFVFVWALNITMMGRDRDALSDTHSMSCNLFSVKEGIHHVKLLLWVHSDLILL